MVRVLVVGQTPPPFLGQPIMLDCLVRSQMPGVQIRHLNMVLSRDVNQVGKFGWNKVLRLFPVIVRILYARIVYRPHILYFAPATATRMSVLRDFVILGATRFLFPRTVFHFHAGGHCDLYARLPRWQRWLFRHTYFGAHAAIRLSEMTPQDGQVLHARREYIVPNGIDDPCAEIDPRPDLAPITRHRPLRMLFVGLLCEAKGLLVLIDACGQLAARGLPFRLDVMGHFQSPEFEATARARVAQWNVGEHVRFLGVLAGAEKLAAFANSDVLCHPTFNDTFGVVILEAMAFGLPVVATRWCSIPSIVDDRETGFLVEPHDPCAVADRLATLAESPQLRERMGIAGREKFLREFTLPRHIERMRRVFLDVADVPDSGAPEPATCTVREHATKRSIAEPKVPVA